MNVTVHGRASHFRTVTFDVRRNAVLLIEQRLLPHEFQIVPTRDFRQTARAIKDMVVRGAGAIGATAAYGLAQGARAFRGRDRAKFLRHLETVGETLGKEEVFGTIEAVKTVSDIYAPCSGKIVEVNGHLQTQPEVVNTDPYGLGWMVKIEIADPSELNSLLDTEAYKKLIGKF